MANKMKGTEIAQVEGIAQIVSTDKKGKPYQNTQNILETLFL